MPDLLLELRSEEIPARMQRKAAGDLKKLITDGLVEAGLTYEAAREYWTPRRLALDVRGLTARSKEVREEIKGPSTSAPEQAVQGFLRKAGLASVAEAQVQSDPKKGNFYVAHIVRPGRAAEDIIAALLPAVVRGFPWPKEMRWGAASGPKGSRYAGVEGRGGETLRWVRPLQSIVCTFGPETEEPMVVDFEIDGIRAGNVTYGHRFHAPDAITVRRFDDYVQKLEAARVILDAERRKAIILADARTAAFASGLDLIEDDGLLEEVAGLVEWPVVLLGEFDADFLDIPAEIIRLTIRANQKCFVCRPADPSSGPSGHLLPQGEKEGRGGAAGSPLRGGRAAGAGGVASNERDLKSIDQYALSTAEPTPPGQPSAGHPPLEGEGDRARLSNRFILTANIEAKDGGAEIAHGNGKVVRARLSDALYFWKTDQTDLPDLDQLNASAEKLGLRRDATGKLLPLDQRMARLDHLGVTFHARLGTQGDRVQRIRRLAEELAPMVMTSISPLAGEMGGSPEGGAVPPGSPPDRSSPTLPPSALPGISPARGEITQLAARAAVLAKADLTSEVVGEFPELQGVMGRKYALLQGEHPAVAAAIEEHYRPQGPSDRVPTDPVSIAVALADKLDTLVGFWAIDEKPTGSKDPYALRRAALGVIRIVVENGVRLGLTDLSFRHRFMIDDQSTQRETAEKSKQGGVFLIARGQVGDGRSVDRDLLAFFHDRLKVYLRDKGARHDLIDAVLASGGDVSYLPLDGGGRREAAGGGEAPTVHTPTPPASAGDPPHKGEGKAALANANDDLLTIVRRVEALGSFLDSADGKNLLAGTRRAVNILAAEEKKGSVIVKAIDDAKFVHPAEKSLFAALNQAERLAGEEIQNEDFSAAMRALSALREPVDSFFEGVLVNDPDEAVRANRLALLARIRAATNQVADFSKIAG